MAYLYYTAISQRTLIETELERETGTLHRIVSQRADQHDAHLTSLSALAISGENPQIDLVLQVAGAIQRFYPRVTEIDLVSLRPDLPSISTRTSSDDVAEIRSVGRAAAARSSGKFELLPSPVSAWTLSHCEAQSEHRCCKIRADYRGRCAYAGKDRIAILEETRCIGRYFRYLMKPCSSERARKDPSLAADSVFTQSLITRRELGSRTQPLILTTKFVYGAGDLFPVERVIIGLVIIGGILAALVIVIKLVSKTRSAEQRARLGEQDARIAHASRVNALGEIASGMAHELNQPLTAILSQSQAGVRLVARGDPDPVVIEKILQTNIAQSKRAADIIVRLREWTRTTPPVSVPQDVNRCIENVVFLLGPDSRRQGIDVTVQTDSAEPQVLGDSVEIEQVLFNLVRNAMEALEETSTGRKTLRVSSQISGQQVVLAVTDNGPGIDPKMRERLFEPFATGKEKGMGLGLVLCERIVERMGGSIEIVDALGGGVAAKVKLPLAAMNRTG